MTLQSYHRAWLTAHPSRTEAWLAAKLADGFDVHHIDGDHQNDAPDNLALIEREDHARFHGTPVGRGPEARDQARLRAGEVAYGAYREHAPNWREIERIVGLQMATCKKHAMLFAQRNGLPWPLWVDPRRIQPVSD